MTWERLNLAVSSLSKLPSNFFPSAQVTPWYLTSTSEFSVACAPLPSSSTSTARPCGAWVSFGMLIFGSFSLVSTLGSCLASFSSLTLDCSSTVLGSLADSTFITMMRSARAPSSGSETLPSDFGLPSTVV